MRGITASFLLATAAFAQTGAQQVTTKQTGTGAVMRNAQVKMNDWLNAADFGVLGNNSHDDCPNLNLAIASAVSTGRALQIVSGTFLCNTVASAGVLLSATLSSASNLTFTGAGMNSTIIKTSTASADLFRIVTTGNPRVYISGISFAGPDGTGSCSTTTSGNGLYVSTSSGAPILDFFDIAAYGNCASGKAGIWLKSPENSTFTNLWAYGNDIGIKLTDAFNANTVNSLIASLNSSYGVYMVESTGNTFNSSTIQSNRKTGWLFGSNTYSNTANAPHFENNNSSLTASTYALDLNAQGTGIVSGNIFNAPYFALNNQDTISISGTSGHNVTNNEFHGGYHPAPNPLVYIQSLFEFGNAFWSFTDLGHISGWQGNDTLCGAFSGSCIFPSNVNTTAGAGFSTGTASNTDLAGNLAMSGGTATRTFAGTFTTKPICTASDITAVNPVRVVTTTTTLTLTGTGSDLVNYICIGLN